jgi:hypothetical protein
MRGGSIGKRSGAGTAQRGAAAATLVAANDVRAMPAATE